MLVRPATAADAPLILDLIRELAEYEHAPEYVVGTAEELERHLFGPQPAASALIAELDGRPAGFAVYYTTFSTWLARPGMWLEDLFVRPEQRGRGAGRALLAEVARIAVERGCGRLEWAVLDWNEPAIGFYRGLGAREVEGWMRLRLTGDELRRVSAGAPARA